MKFHALAIVFLAAITFSCSCNNSSADKSPIQKKVAVKKLSSLEKPKANTKLVLGEEIPVSITYPDTMTLDSVHLFFRGNRTGTYIEGEEMSISTEGSLTGKAGLRLKLFFNNGKTETHGRQVEVLSDIVPQQYSYKIVKQYPHDIASYTQGLLFHEGSMYEGTGNYNQSYVRKVQLSDGTAIQHKKNASNIFGEGICVFDGKLYQLTYKSQICFVYDLSTFEEVQKLYYQNREGWGLSCTDKELIMSDGSHMLHFLDPGTFAVNSYIEVYDDKGPILDLNELEYIEGKIYANRYYTDEIVIIDPQSGKVEGRIDLKGILPVSERKASTNVLNGIAWKGGEHLFVTGKYWPKLYEIQVVKK